MPPVRPPVPSSGALTARRVAPVVTHVAGTNTGNRPSSWPPAASGAAPLNLEGFGSEVDQVRFGRQQHALAG